MQGGTELIVLEQMKRVATPGHSWRWAKNLNVGSPLLTWDALKMSTVNRRSWCIQSILRPEQQPLLSVCLTAPKQPMIELKNTAPDSTSTQVAMCRAAGKVRAATCPDDTSPEATTKTKLTRTKKSSPQQKNSLMAALSLPMVWLGGGVTSQVR